MDGGKDLIICSFGDEYIAGDDNVVSKAAEFLDCSYENFAQWDTSNNRIQIEVTKRAIQFGHEDVLFVIGWTDPERLDAEGEEHDFTYRRNENIYPNEYMNKLHPYDDYLFDPILISTKWASQVYGCQQMLENKNIKYFMFNTQKHLYFNKYNEQVIRNFDHKKYYDCINEQSTLKNAPSLEKYTKFISRKLKQLGYIQRQ